MRDILIIDDFFEQKEHQKLFEFCINSSYNFNEYDRPGVPPIGGSFLIKPKTDLFSFLDQNLRSKVEFITNNTCYRQTINIFLPNERPYFHTDSMDLSYTCLYYPNIDFDIDEGGETQLIINNEIKGILPKPNRMIIFDGRIYHKATSFRSKHRFTYAIKYTS